MARNKFSVVKWSPEDVQTMRPQWSLNRCRRELADIERYMKERLTELGWEVLEALIEMNDTSEHVKRSK